MNIRIKNKMESNRGRYLILTSGLQMNIHRHVHICIYRKETSQYRIRKWNIKKKDKKQVKYKKFKVHYIKQKAP